MNSVRIVALAVIIFICTFSQVRAETAEEWKTKGNNYLVAGKYSRALECYEKSLEIDPCYGRSVLNMGYTYHELGEYEKSLDYCNKALELLKNEKDTSDLPLAYVLVHKSYALLDLRRYDEALACSGKALDLEPDDFFCLDCRAYVLLNVENYEEAIEYFDRAMEINPEKDYIWSGKALALYNLEKYNEALECYDKAIELAPEEIEHFVGKGNCYDDMKRFEEAIDCYNKALDYDSEYIPALLNKALSLFSLGMNKNFQENYGRGKDCFDKALETDPNFEDTDIEERYQQRISLLHIAALYNNKDLAKALISRGLDVNTEAKKGIIPFHFACLNLFFYNDETTGIPGFSVNAKNLAEYLLAEGADIDAPMEAGETLLHVAVRDGMWKW